MPEDDAPISTTVPESTTIDTGVDKETLGNLNDSFEDFWKGEDQKDDTKAPAAPGDGAAQETTKAPEVKGEDESELHEPVKALSDEDIDKLVLPDDARPDHVQDFKRVRDMWKADRARFKEESEKVSKLAADLEEARKNSLTPEVKADYENAAAVRRKFEFTSDPEFQAKFVAPIGNQFNKVLAEAVDVLADRQAAVEWANGIARNYTPDSKEIDRNWWLHSVIAKVPNELDRASLLGSVTELLKMKRDRDDEIIRRTNDKSSYDNWKEEQNQLNLRRVQEEVKAEIAIQEQRIQEILPRDVTQAKTPAEKEAIESHNEVFAKLNTRFQDRMKDMMSNGARASVRVAVDATRADYLEGEYKNIEKELKSVKEERDQLQRDLDKITGARRKISATSGTPPATAKKNGDGLTLKKLDIKESFKDFDWEAGT